LGVEPSIDSLVSRVAEQHHGVFAAHHLRDLGVARHERNYRLAAGRWAVVHEGAYRVAGVPLTWRGQVLAACWAGGVRAVASHRSAAELWGLPGRTTKVVELMCPRWRRARHDGIVVHETRVIDDRATTIDRIPVTSAARTLFDLAAVVGPITLDLAVEQALRRQLTDVAELELLLEQLARRGRRGITKLRRVLASRVPGQQLTESEGERVLVLALIRQGLPEPVAQYEIRDTDGRLVARVDFAYPDHKIAIEYDSYEHHTGRDALVRDGARRNAIVALGWLPITATANDLANGGRRLAIDIRRARSIRSGVAGAE
jgi:predicted transcriptional regulator of viral defense system